MHAELRSWETLQALGLAPAPGETCLDAVQRIALEADRVLRPYRYPAQDGMRAVFGLWWAAWSERERYTLPGGYVHADVLNIFQAGYTAREVGGE